MASRLIRAGYNITWVKTQRPTGSGRGTNIARVVEQFADCLNSIETSNRFINFVITLVLIPIHYQIILSTWIAMESIAASTHAPTWPSPHQRNGWEPTSNPLSITFTLIRQMHPRAAPRVSIAGIEFMEKLFLIPSMFATPMIQRVFATVSLMMFLLERLP